MPRSLIPVAEELSEARLTVLAQTVSPNDQGVLKWDAFFPRQNVDSVDLHEVTTLDFRPVSDRRAWNSPGRLIPDKTPDLRDISIIPVEGYYKWGEYEMQKIRERARNLNVGVEQIIGATIPGKVTQITEANYRRIEVDAMTAWSQGIITVKNPQTGETYQASFGFASDRLTTAGTAWDDAGVSAYDEFIAWLEDAVDLVGPIEGVVLRLPVLRAIQEDAPDMAGGVPMTRGALPEAISDAIGFPFQFFLFEDTLDIFTDGGTATTSTNVWPVGRVAAVPRGGNIGRTAFAPVVRAMDLVAQLPQAGIDERGMTVYYDEAQAGKELRVEVQANPVTIPNEQRVAVINTGITS
jgi:hypothetical protein